jgi:nucleotide-binding universal stress UspA family protein
MTTATFAAIVAVARRNAQLAAAEFDYQLSLGTELGYRAYNALGNAIYQLANDGQPEVTEGAHDIHRERTARADALRALIADDIDLLVEASRRKTYTGWSEAGSGRIQYGPPT